MAHGVVDVRRVAAHAILKALSVGSLMGLVVGLVIGALGVALVMVLS